MQKVVKKEYPSIEVTEKSAKPGPNENNSLHEETLSHEEFNSEKENEKVGYVEK